MIKPELKAIELQKICRTKLGDDFSSDFIKKMAKAYVDQLIQDMPLLRGSFRDFPCSEWVVYRGYWNEVREFII